MPRLELSSLAHVLRTTALVVAIPAAASAQFTRVSGGAGAQPDGPHGGGVINAAGTHVAFVSAAANLVASDGNASADVFVRDLLGGTTSRASVASDGSERQGHSGVLMVDAAGLPFSGQLDISNDGRFVVFVSRAPLVAEDTQLCTVDQEPAPSNCPDIYLRDRQTGQTVRLSVPTAGGQANGASRAPQISGDGRWVVFESDATNLVPGDTNGVTDIFLFDRQAGVLSRISLSTGGAQADQPATAPSISDDGQVVAFVSASSTLSAEPDTVTCEGAPPACERPFLHDRVPGETRRIPMPAFVTSAHFGRIAVTYRVTTPRVHVAPDGGSVAVTAASMQNFFTITTGSAATVWVFDRGLNRITWDFSPNLQPGSRMSASAWDGRRLTYSWGVMGSIVSGGVVLLDTTTGLSEDIARAPSALIGTIDGVQSNGRRLLFGTTERKTPDDTDDRFDLYVLDRDPDADGMPTAWETLFGLDPANGVDGLADHDLDGVSSADEHAEGSHPTGGVRHYLAEGAANAFFTTRLAILNPAQTAAVAVVGQLGENGRRWSRIVSLAGQARATVLPAGAVSSSFSTVVESSLPLVVDRTMSWDATGYGSHAEAARGAPTTTWFLAEGATHGRFHLFYLLQNPGRNAANVIVTYLRPTPEAPLVRPYTVAAESRLTIWVDTVPELAATDVSARIVSDQPILVERAMYMDVGDPLQPFGAGHAGAGVAAAAPRWFLAEGATGTFFDLYYLIANPSTQGTRVRITYLLPAGAPIVREHDVARESRLTVAVDFVDPLLANTPVSAVVESLDGTGIVVERSMWWPGEGLWHEGHLAAGATAAARRWALAEGEVDGQTETYVLIANPSAVAATATLTLVREGSEAPHETRQVALPPNSRVNVPMSQYEPVGGRRFGVIVESDGPDIVVERAMYTTAGGVVWAAGTAALGTPLP